MEKRRGIEHSNGGVAAVRRTWLIIALACQLADMTHARADDEPELLPLVPTKKKPEYVPALPDNPRMLKELHKAAAAAKKNAGAATRPAEPLEVTSLVVQRMLEKQ